MPRMNYIPEREEKKAQIIGRITEQLKKTGKRRRELIEYLHLPVGTYGNWVKGKGCQYMLYIDDIARFLGVSVEYLINGSNPYNNDMERELRKDEVELLKVYNRMDKENQSKIIRIMGVLTS